MNGKYRTYLPTTSKPIDAEALRDHAKRMLRAIVTDLNTEQSAERQIEQSHGQGPLDTNSAATSHGFGRLMTGFSINHFVAEFRALCASVVHQWMKKIKQEESCEVNDVIRFNEAIDQGLFESITTYTEAICS